MNLMEIEEKIKQLKDESRVDIGILESELDLLVGRTKSTFADTERIYREGMQSNRHGSFSAQQLLDLLKDNALSIARIG